MAVGATAHKVSGMPRSLVAIAIIGLLMVTGCGSEEGDEPNGQLPGDGAVSVAHPRFEGRFNIVDVEVDGARVAVEGEPNLTIDAEFGELTVEAGCNQHFGSFTLTEDGRASFTITGGSADSCGSPIDGAEANVLAALDDVTGWSEVDGGFRFDGPMSSIVARGPT